MPVVQESRGTSLAMPDDLRADLLRAQQQEITTPQQLPQIVIMGAGAGLYEFPEEEHRTVADFYGVILGSHESNVLWTKPYGQQGLSDEEKLPDCSSIDGQFGVPKPGFRHKALGGREATLTDRIECKGCPYNKFGSGNLFLANRNPKGKAVTNNKRLYVAMENSLTPYELVLPPTSITPFDEYLTKLRRQGRPVQSVLTKFTQQRLERNGQRYGVAVFTDEADLQQDVFMAMIAMRQEYKELIYPSAPPVTEVRAPASASAENIGSDLDTDDDTPF